MRNAWAYSASEEILSHENNTISNAQTYKSATLIKPINRNVNQSLVTENGVLSPNDANSKKDFNKQVITIRRSSYRKLVDWHSVSNKTNFPRFQLYILPVKE